MLATEFEGADSAFGGDVSVAVVGGVERGG